MYFYQGHITIEQEIIRDLISASELHFFQKPVLIIGIFGNLVIKPVLIIEIFEQKRRPVPIIEPLLILEI